MGDLEASLKDTLPIYYKRFFPFEKYHQWLSYGSVSYFSRREFSFEKDSIYSRYNSFLDVNDLRNSVVKRCPQKIDIGAVFNESPSNHSKVEIFIPVEKELVFDIDATDYDDVLIHREEGVFITSRTWPLMSIAIKVLDDVLSTDFGYKHILWVFSGRRGIHAWVCDSRARKLPDAARSSVAEYLQVLWTTEGNLEDNRKVVAKVKRTLHPTLKRLYQNILEPHFVQYMVVGQNLFCDPLHTEQLLSFAPTNDIREALKLDWSDANNDSEQRWHNFVATINAWIKKTPNNQKQPIYELVFSYTYPRLDINVSKQLNHLLKSPFVIHPGTGRKRVDQFDPSLVPKITDLLNDIDNYKGESDVSDIGKTRLLPYYKTFEKFVNSLKSEGVDVKVLKKEDPMNF